MAKPKKKKRKRPVAYDGPEINPTAGEDRRSVAITVAWMLTLMATLGANILSLLAAATMPLLVANAEKPGLALVLPRLLLFIAVLCGAVWLIMTPAVYRFREIPPPIAITYCGAIASIAPILALVYWIATV